MSPSASRVRQARLLLLLFLGLSGLATQFENSKGPISETAAGSPTFGLTASPSPQPGFDGFVKNTLILSNGSLVSGNVPTFNGYGPQIGPAISVPNAVAYDGEDNRVFVTNGHSLQTALSIDTVTIIDANTNRMMKTVPVADPGGITWDPAHNQVYVASTPGVTVLNATTGNVITNVTLTSGTSGVLYDVFNNDVYVSDYTSGLVYVIDTSTNKLVTSVTVGAKPTGISLDGNNHLYVNCLESGFVPVIDGAINKILANVTVPSPPGYPPPSRPAQPPFQNIVYDISDKNIYLADYLSPHPDTVYVISSLTNSVIGHFTVGNLAAVAGLLYNIDNDGIYLTNGAVSSISDGSGDTLSRFDVATGKLVANVTVGYGASGIAYDTHDHVMYVAGSRSYSVSAVDSRTDFLSSTIFFQTYPGGVAYDSKNGVLYAVNQGSFYALLDKDAYSNSVLAINTTDYSIRSIPVGIGPISIVYDSHNGYLYVTNILDQVVVLDPSTGSIIATITIAPGYVEGIAYNSMNHVIYVASNVLKGPTLSVIDDTSNTVVSSFDAGHYSLGLAYDPANDNLYITHWGTYANSVSNFVTVVSGSTNTVIANVTVGSILGSRPAGIIYDKANGDIYVADVGSEEVSVIDGNTDHVIATIPVVLSSNPFIRSTGLIYDPENDEILVTDAFPQGFSGWTNNTVVIDGTSNVVLGNFGLGYNPVDGVFDPSNGILYAANYYSGTLSLIESSPHEDFAVNVHPSILQAQAGNTVSATINVTGTGKFIGEVSLDVEASTSGPVPTLSPSTISLSPSHETGTATLALGTNLLPPGVYTTVVNGTSNGRAHSASLTVEVIVSASFVCWGSGNCDVTSDGAITGLTFTANTVRFEVTGPPGASAFANITIPRSSISNVNQLSVTVDGNPLPNSEVSVTGGGAVDFIYFTFTFHSSVDVAVTIQQANVQPASPLIPTEWVLGIIIIGAAVVTLGAVTLKKRTKPKQTL